ncbi:MAG: hypothetical protein AAGH60_01845 [Pseudomonadota bacterium]
MAQLLALVVGGVILLPALSSLLIGKAHAQDVVFDDVLANPDDLDLNIRFLQTQLAVSDFKGAAVTLQRILLLNPLFDEARLIRTAVFLRLGEDEAARSDLEFLSTRPLTPEQAAEAERLSALVTADPSAPTVRGVIRAGSAYMSNGDLEPGSGSLAGQLFNFPTDGALVGFGEISFVGEMPIAAGSGNALIVEGRARARGFGGSDSYLFGRLAAGPRLDFGVGLLDVLGLARVDAFDGEYYSHQLGGRLRATFELTDRIEASARVSAVHEAVDIDRDLTVNIGDADGLLAYTHPSIRFAFNNAWSITAHGLAGLKDAGSDWFSYTFYGGGATLRYRTASGFLWRAFGEVAAYDYDDPDPRFAGSSRDDTRYRIETSVAVPVGLIAESLGQSSVDAGWSRGWALEAFVRQSVIQSNIDVYDRTNWSVGLSVARRFSL